MENRNKKYFSAFSAASKLSGKVINRAAAIAAKVLDKHIRQQDRLCWAAALYAAIAAAEMAAPGMMAAGQRLYMEMQEDDENGD